MKGMLRPGHANGAGNAGNPTAVGARITVAMVWRDTLVAFSDHSASILAGALFGFAMTAILAAILGALMTLEMYARTSTILVSYGPHRIVPLIFQGVVGLLVGSLARGGGPSAAPPRRGGGCR